MVAHRARPLIGKCNDGSDHGGAVANDPGGYKGALPNSRDPQPARRHPGDSLVAAKRAASVDQLTDVEPGGRGLIPVDKFNQAHASHDGGRQVSSLQPERYFARPVHHDTYNELCRLYRRLHDSFGGLKDSVDAARVMKRRIEIKYAQHAKAA
jgi:hypothetical protein